MKEASKRFLLLSSLLLCLVLAAILVAIGLLAPVLQVVFVPYQFFLTGICVGALLAATAGLIVERNGWTNYRLYFCTVMVSVFLLVVANLVIFRVLGGEQFIRRLMKIFLVVFNLR
ncbi:MAG: hypothetical protein C4532_19940 [Candidatus Abyssobacteria bacterium SURF_17]|uniref:Uncharacterized protein n=1 Tax=Candidatus Abyssobacteria bacterium SURF_17 TaxID=2093361 RepID=A0A419EN48_9BACT|nr:MAG: hypothetical protein C4532_19940 [Candidatus Abyssubacteria bacterium SURF_17]